MSNDVSHVLGWVAAVILLLAVVLVVTGVPFIVFRTAVSVGGSGTALPNGYRLVRFHGEDVAMCGPDNGEVLIESVIDSYSVCGDIVVGHVSPSAHHQDSIPGYFVVDTRNRQVRRGLSKEEWRQMLVGYGLSESPGLQRPTD